mgnify:CR=1 FL=1
MKITKRQLRRIIKEEIQRLAEDSYDQQQRQDEMSGFHGKEPSANILPTDEEAMKSFVSKEFEAGMNMDKFDLALERFEVKFNIDYPDSIFKINDILEDMGDEGLARGLRRLYQGEFEDRDRKNWDDH